MAGLVAAARARELGAEPVVYEKFLDGKRISPRHIMVELDGKEVYEVFYTWDTQSVFDTLDRAMTELRTPARSRSAISQGVQSALVEVDASMGALQGLRSRVGETLNRADLIEGRLREQKVTAQAERSQAEDLDMVEAISLFQNRQSGYQAALQAYASVQKLSLFQYLNT